MKPVKFFGIGCEQPNQFIISWNLGNSCNWSCEYCPPFLNDKSVYWTDNEIIKKTLQKIKQKITNQQIRVEFMGGEVTLKPDFVELMKFCKDLGLYTHIVTNASRTINYWEKLSPYLNSAYLTFHPQNADKVHYENVIDTLFLHNVTPVSHLAMVKSYFDELVEYKKYLLEKYNNKLHVDFLLLYDKENKLNNNGYFYDYDANQINFLSHNTGKHFTIEYENGERQDLSYTEVRDSELNNFLGFKCGSRLNMLNVDYWGGASISTCAQRKRININTDDIERLLEPIICKQEICNNPSDLRLYKFIN